MRTHLQSAMLNSVWSYPETITHSVGSNGNNYSTNYPTTNMDVTAPVPPAYTSPYSTNFYLFAPAQNGNQGGFIVVEPDTYEMKIFDVSGWTTFNASTLANWRSQATLYNAGNVSATFIGPGTAQYTIKIRRIADAVEMGAVTFQLYSAT